MMTQIRGTSMRIASKWYEWLTESLRSILPRRRGISTRVLMTDGRFDSWVDRAVAVRIDLQGYKPTTNAVSAIMANRDIAPYARKS